jgi:LppP/LprE lipoprotein
MFDARMRDAPGEKMTAMRSANDEEIDGIDADTMYRDGSTMKSASSIVIAALLATVTIAGCGSGATRTVSVSSPPGATRTGPSTSKAGTASHATTASTDTGQSKAAPPARTATSPAFTREPSGGDGVEQAVAVVKAHGYVPGETAQYHPDQTLRVLLATRTGSAVGHPQQAFFFVDDHYIGTDASAPSAGVRLVSQGDTEVALAYRLYRPGDPLCCAHGGEATVRFQLNNGRLVALDPIPPVSSSTAPSRR